MKTLYVSDLDGTLLQSNERTSEYTNNIINELVERGMLFSYARQDLLKLLIKRLSD